MRFALRTNYGEGAIWLLQDKTVKFPFIEQFNTQKEQPPRLLLFLYPRAARLFFMRLRCQPNGNLIGKAVEKSGNVWYNGSVMADNLPYKSEFMEGKNVNR